ncbi:MAG TPA: hypothetical protein VFJ58_02300 [Armatimonadota bacterium]|nr:hypothetical protein [Armatimonadota bacterium]
MAGVLPAMVGAARLRTSGARAGQVMERVRGEACRMGVTFRKEMDGANTWKLGETGGNCRRTPPE